MPRLAGLLTDLSLSNVPHNAGAFFLHSRIPGEVAHWMALLPLAWLTLLYWRGLRCGTAWWVLAAAFAVSWVADTWAHYLPVDERWPPSLVYPVAQTAIIGSVLLPRRSQAWCLLGALVVVGLAAVWVNDTQGPDMLLRTFAWFAILAICLFRADMPSPLRFALCSYFGVGWVCWAAWVKFRLDGDFGVWMWYPYQLARLIGLLLFCQAAVRPEAVRRA